jgi:hypothetical protein
MLLDVVATKTVSGKLLEESEHGVGKKHRRLPIPG